VGEDSPAGLGEASRAALERAEYVFGAPRHLALVGLTDSPRARLWPVPFSVEPVLALRGQGVAVLASGDPFWHGAGASLAAHLEPAEWRTWPAPSTFSLAAARLGWRIEETACLGLHAAPFARLMQHLHDGGRAICLLRDGASAWELAGWLTGRGFGGSTLHVLEALGGERERIRTALAEAFALDDVAAPVAVAIEMRGGLGLARASGLPDTLFAHDGQITKRPVRALTLSALAPRPGELLWDLGAGSGSISVEWCLAGGRAIAVERTPERAANTRANALSFGVEHRLAVQEGDSAALLASLPAPHAVFIGGGAGEALLEAVWERLTPGARLVANAVTLETEALLALWHGQHGGDLLRIELAAAAPLGTMRGWVPARPVVQWSVAR